MSNEYELVKMMHLIYARCPICGNPCNYVPGVPDKMGWKSVEMWECVGCRKRFDTPDFFVIPSINGLVAVKEGRVIGSD